MHSHKYLRENTTMIRKLLTISAFTFALLLTASAAQAQSQLTFVSITGNDANTASLCSASNPCRSFGAALSVTNTNGEIIALTSGGYGPVTVDKGVRITAPNGVYAAIIASSGNAITVNTPAGAVVVLRGLTLNSKGATFGINATAVGALHIEGCIVNGFTGKGIWVNLAADGSKIFIKDTISRNNGGDGIRIETTTGIVNASITGCRAEYNNYGFMAAERSRVTVSDSVASGNDATGFVAASIVSGASAEMNADHCVASNNQYGFAVQGLAGSTTTMRVARSTVTNNSIYGFAQVPGGTFESLGDNIVRGNGTDTFGTITVVSGS